MIDTLMDFTHWKEQGLAFAEDDEAFPTRKKPFDLHPNGNARDSSIDQGAKAVRPVLQLLLRAGRSFTAKAIR